MIYLTINPGSSSLKYAMYSKNQSLLGIGKIAHITSGDVIHTVSLVENGQKKEILSEKIHNQTIEAWMQLLYDDANHYFNSYTANTGQIVPIIRVVHDGGLFSGPVRATQSVVTQLESLSGFAPLHMPLALKTIALSKELWAAQSSDPWLVFDTHFHRSLPLVAQSTGLPRSVEERLVIRRYGFHGLSHQYVMEQISQKVGQKHAIISCHLGGGSSVCAIENTRSIETSMGSGPGTGVMMATRSGDVDWEALMYLMETDNLTPAQIRTLLYKHSGILGMNEHTELMPDLLAHQDNPIYKQTIEQFVYRVVKTIGSYVPLFRSKPTHIVFTGGIGSGSSAIRELIIDNFAALNWSLSAAVNQQVGDAQKYYQLQNTDSDIAVIVMPTDEESIMVQQVKAAELAHIA